DHWFVHEVLLHMARTLRRLDLTSRSFFALGDSTSAAFAGCLLELALAADRFYLLDDPGCRVGVSPLNFGTLPMTHGFSRLSVRLAGEPDRLSALAEAAERQQLLGPEDADDAGLVTVRLDDID